MVVTGRVALIAVTLSAILSGLLVGGRSVVSVVLSAALVAYTEIVVVGLALSLSGDHLNAPWFAATDFLASVSDVTGTVGRFTRILIQPLELPGAVGWDVGAYALAALDALLATILTPRARRHGLVAVPLIVATPLLLPAARLATRPDAEALGASSGDRRCSRSSSATCPTMPSSPCGPGSGLRRSSAQVSTAPSSSPPR